ncbi:hypothetical protein OKHIL_01930 [Mycolicibacterium mageritense]
MSLQSGATFAGFTVVRLLGSGGMGQVYLVRHPRLPRNDALKILPRALAEDRDYRLRFEREADAAAALWHPNIVGVHDRGEYDGQLWISMDFVDGADAGQVLRERFPHGMPRDEAVQIVSAMADALDYAHSCGLLHRDVKPSNILLAAPKGNQRRILLADFGIARQLDDVTGLTATNMTVGTISYAAPEQLMDGPIDGRADQYALAATAFHLLTGSAPYAHSNPAVVISRRLSGPVPRLAETHRELADLDGAMGRALAVDPDQRFASCQDFAAALRAERAVTPPPPQPFEAAAPTMFAQTPPMFTAHAPNVRPAGPMSPPGPPTVQGVPRGRRSGVMIALAGVGMLLLGAVALVAVLLTRDGQPPATTESSATATTERAAPPVTVTVPSTVTVAPPSTSSRMVLPDADTQGFVGYNGAARCGGRDRAVMILRTPQSAVVICRDSAGAMYYRGLRLSDGSTIELGGASAFDGGYAATNPEGPTRYEVSRDGLRIVRNGDVLATEPAVESASP